VARLLLWDIDGTILTARQTARTALFAAVEEVLGREVERVELQTAGKTDPLIARELLTALGVPADDMQITVRRVLRKYGPQLAARRQEITNEGKIFDGVRELLYLIDQTRAVNTVLTGNIAVNAICKLDAFHLTRHFDLEVGAFGSDDADRAKLVQVALDRIGDKRRRFFSDDEIWIIGDTPGDFAVARANNTRCILVANGDSTIEELEALGPDVVLPDFTDPEKIMPLFREPED
jgi:phosphoglycolate phosphatase